MTIDTLSPAKKAWLTRRAHAQARADVATLVKGVDEPSPAHDPNKPFVAMWVDDKQIGSGFRRFIVLDVGLRTVRLFCAPRLIAITVDRLTFDRHAKPVDANRVTLRKIIRANIALADRINDGAAAVILPDGGADSARALEVLG